MATIFLDEIETNAVTAALFERSQRLGRDIGRLITQPATEDRDFALAANQQALRHTELALMRISGSLPDLPEPPDAIDEAKAEADRLNPYPEPPAGWQEAELAAAWGR
jgi:hypothetical protein